MSTATVPPNAAPGGPSDASWAPAAAAHWGGNPVRLRAPAPFGTGRAYRLLAEAARPFRYGTRFQTLPDVRFSRDDGRLRAPAGMLPDPGGSDAGRSGDGEDGCDRDADAYQDRLDGLLGGHGHLLTANQPLFTDPELWLRVRDTVEELWRLVGWPVLPLAAQLTLGDRFTRREELAAPGRTSSLTWVLRGRMTVELWPGAAELPADPGEPAHTLTGGPGDLLLCPAGMRMRDHHEERCLALRLVVPADPRQPANSVKDLLGDHLVDGARTAVVPYLPFPPPAGPDGGIGPAGPVAATAHAVHDALGDPALRRTVLRRWLACRSAAGLEPAPAPRPAPEAGPETGFRLASPVLRVPDGDAGALWAVNGRVFSVSGKAADRVLDAVRDAGSGTVGDILHAVGAPAADQAVPALLRRLHALRGIDLTPPTPRTTASPQPQTQPRTQP